MKTTAALFFAAILAGCSTSQNPQQTVTATGDAIQRADAYTVAADQTTTAAKPHADAVGRSLLDQTTRSHADARRELRDAAASNQKTAKEIDQLQDANDALVQSWGHRFELLCRRIWRDIWVIVGIYAALVAVLWVLTIWPGGIIGAVAGSIESKINPVRLVVWIVQKIRGKSGTTTAA